jgi:hypothetical protein
MMFLFGSIALALFAGFSYIGVVVAHKSTRNPGDDFEIIE